MKIKIITVTGKGDELTDVLFEHFLRRMQPYHPVKWEVVKQGRGRTDPEAIIKKGSSFNDLILLDENGKEYSSTAFSAWLQNRLNRSRDILFVIGGAYGFDDSLKKQVPEKISLSRMTLPHHLAKVILAEQLYRAFTILHHEPYHH